MKITIAILLIATIYVSFMGIWVLIKYSGTGKHTGKEYSLVKFPMGVAIILAMTYAYFCDHLSLPKTPMYCSENLLYQLIFIFITYFFIMGIWVVRGYMGKNPKKEPLLISLLPFITLGIIFSYGYLCIHFHF